MNLHDLDEINQLKEQKESIQNRILDMVLHTQQRGEYAQRICQDYRDIVHKIDILENKIKAVDTKGKDDMVK